MKISEPRSKQTERLRVLLALAGEKPPEKGACPSDAQLAAFIERRVRGKAHKEMLAHLRACPDCYNTWQMVTNEFQPEPLWHTVMARAGAVYALFRNASGNFVTWRPGKPAYAGLAIALLLSITLAFTPSPDSGINATIQMIASQNTEAVRNALDDFPLPWETPGNFGFSAPSQASSSALAFEAGLLWTHRQLLSEKEQTLLPPEMARDRVKTQWADYYELGQRMLLLRVVSQFQNELPKAAFWHQQRQALAKLHADFKLREKTDGEAKRVTAMLEKLEPVLAALPDESAPHLYDKLARKLDSAMNSLAPYRRTQ
ncbi:MAG: hypothetical protein GY862_20290 [Gammaproteobacteria bacterium]|nr:hypothetical protein [Gammaproteobacteria bacterium]